MPIPQNKYFDSLRRQNMYHPHLPQYHFVPPANLMNDPNGLLQWGNHYHMFYQYNPNGAFHGTKHWGHVASSDLIYWSDRPIALTPTPHSPDSTGCWSGSAIDWNGTPALIYTGTQGVRNEIQTQCLATSDDHLISWTKYAGNPVIDEIPAFAGQKRNFRDPYIFRDGDGWSVVLGSQIAGQGGVLFLYHSTDMIHWDYKGVLLSGIEAETGSPWECPSFFPLGDRFVLIFSSLQPHKRIFYHVGSYENFHFSPEYSGVVEHGVMYAPQVFGDHAGRRLMFGWIEEERPSDIQKAIGWSGAMTLPRELTLGANGVLRQTVAEEAARLRTTHQHFDPAALASPQGENRLLIDSRTLECRAILKPLASGEWRLRVLCHPEQTEYTDVVLDFSERVLRVERQHSSLDPDTVSRTLHVSLASLDAASSDAGHWELQLYLDQSVLEIIVNDQISLTARAYATLENSGQVRVIDSNTENPVQSLDIWQLSSIWDHLKQETPSQLS